MQANTLPNNSALAEQQVLKAFDSWAQRTRLSVTSITPQWKHDADNYVTLECRVDASGTLDRLSQFLYEIERDPMALKVEQVEITAKDKTGSLLTLGLQVSGLVLTPDEKRK